MNTFSIQAPLTIEKIKELYYNCGYIYNESFNIFSVRTKNGQVNKFNDYIVVVNNGVINVFTVTVDPGLYYMKNLLNKAGAGAIVHGQYVDCYAVDKHQGKYEALCQRLGNVKVYRDNNLDNVYDYKESSIQEGMFGVNIHHAGEDSMNVDNWSAACTVFKRKKDFLSFMKIITKQSKLNNNKFTYSVFDESKQNLDIKITL